MYGNYFIFDKPQHSQNYNNSIIDEQVIYFIFLINHFRYII